MTLEERADLILSLVDVDKKLLKSGVFESVAAEIREAVEERKGNSLSADPKEWFCLDCRPIAEELSRQAMLNGKAEAFEEAAKIAETIPEEPLKVTDFNKGYAWASVSVAEKIRARAAEVQP